MGATRPYRGGDLLAWAATLRAAAPYQRDRPGVSGEFLRLRVPDLRGRPRRGPAGCLLLFVVDASGSMAAWRRMRQTKAAVLALLVQAYRRRDRVALLAFRGVGAELVLPPARGLGAAREALERLPVGGTTPLAHGLAAACRLVRAQRRRQPRLPVWAVVLTDGRANVPAASADPWRDALGQARALAACATECLVVDTETGRPRRGRAAELARTLGARCLPLEGVLGRPLADPWRRAV
jgi:magnesium chelatase subunit D